MPPFTTSVKAKAGHLFIVVRDSPELLPEIRDSRFFKGLVAGQLLDPNIDEIGRLARLVAPPAPLRHGGPASIFQEGGARVGLARQDVSQRANIDQRPAPSR